MGVDIKRSNARINRSLISLLIAILILSFQNCGKGFETFDANTTGFSGNASIGVIGGSRLIWAMHPLAGTEDISGYRIYLKVNNEPTFMMIAQLTDVYATSVNLNNLNVTLNQENANYLQMTAYNAGDESDPTPVVCWGTACR